MFNNLKLEKMFNFDCITCFDYWLWKKNWGISGTLRVQSFNNSGVTNFTSWQFDFQPEHYKRCCSSITNMTHIVSGSAVGGGIQYTCHNGTRLTNVGLVKVRMRRVTGAGGPQPISQFIQIVP